MRDRYYWRTIGYHVWAILRRADENMPEDVRPDSDRDSFVETVGARGRGDQAAKDYCRAEVARLNAGIRLDNRAIQLRDCAHEL